MRLATAIRNVILLAVSMPALAAAPKAEQGGGGLRCIAIDPGHGGKDPGAVGNGQQEKAINLGVALKLGRMIEQQLPGVRVVYTRRDDRFISLADRSRIAAQEGADLFISIHTNSSPGSSATGTETYVMGEDKDNRNLSVVMRENAVISLEPDYSSRYEGYDPNSSESLILFSLMQYVYQSQSLSLAEMIQSQYASHAERRNKGVKQAGFLVLWRTPMPSVLTEVGFISNPAEARFLGSAEGQERIAASIFRAIREYKRQTDSRTVAASTASTTAGRKTAPTASSASSTASARKTTSTAVTSATPKRTTTSAPVLPPSDRKPAPKQTAKPAAKNPSGDGRTLFRIQVKSALSRIPLTRANFGEYADRTLELRIDGRYKYFYGASISYQEALLLQRQVRRSFPDAFMVAFRDGRPIPLAEAIGR